MKEKPKKTAPSATLLAKFEHKKKLGQFDRFNEEFVKTNRALGELGHPDTPTLNLERVSHKIVSLKEA